MDDLQASTGPIKPQGVRVKMISRSVYHSGKIITQ